MKIIPLKKDKYELIRELMNSLLKKGVFSDFNSSNIMVFDLKSLKFAIAFTSLCEDREFGVAIFKGNEGINCLIDILTLPGESIFEGDYDNLFVLSYSKKDDLLFQEKIYLDDKKIKTKFKNNLSMLSYKRGLAPYVPTNKEANDLISILYLINHIFDISYEEIKEHFKNKDIEALLVDINMHKHTFSLNFGLMPKLKEDKSKKIASMEEVNYFKDLLVKDYTINVRVHSLSIPVKIKECNKAVSPTLITIGKPSSEFDFDFLISNIDEQREQMIIILREFFKKNGIPSKIVFDNRYFYNELSDIFDKMNVEVCLDLDMLSDGLFIDVEHTLYKVFEPIVFIDQAFNTISEDSARLSLNTIKKMFSLYNLGIEDFEYSEEEKETVMAFIDTISDSSNSSLDDGMNFDDEDENIEKYIDINDDLEKKLVS